MKYVVIILYLASAHIGSAPRAETPIFACSLGQKRVTVTATGDELVYRYGTRAKNEITIVGSAARRNVFFRTGRYANIENQIRFTRGAFSYIVFSEGGKPSVGARPVSGLTVLRGTKPVAEFTCRRWTELDSNRFDFGKLPADSEAYSAL